MLPANYDIQHYRGDALSLRFRFVDQDLTGQTILCQCRRGLEVGSQKLFDFSVVTTVDGTNTLVDLSLEAEVTELLAAGVYYWDMQVGDYTRIGGQFEIVADVSRA